MNEMSFTASTDEREDSKTQQVVDVQPATGQYQFCPWEQFDAAWYAAQYMRRPAPGEPTDPAIHYRDVGALRGLSPNPFFDEAWYRSQYADVRHLIGHGQIASGFAHYCATGHVDRDPHWLFTDHTYRARRGDLSTANLATNGLRNGYHHFLIAGQNERTSGSSFFDPRLVAQEANIVDWPFNLFVTEPRICTLRLSPYFDADWYMAMYEQVPDLIANGTYTCALHHYLTNPTPLLFAGSPDFDEAFYAERYPDIGHAIAAGTLRTGYQHFIDSGRFDDRQPSPWFDPVAYRRHPLVAKQLQAQPTLTPFDHYLSTGRSRGIPTVQPPHARVVPLRPGTEAAGKDIFVRMAHFWASQGRRPNIAFAQPAQPDISVVICAFNQFDLTLQTLMHLAGSIGHGGFEIILIDNASMDETREIECHVDGLRLIRNATNEGFLKATNQGIGQARGRFVLLLNNDVILPPQTLALALARMQASPDIGALGGRVVRTHGLLQEAGCTVFRTGSTVGYGRDQDPFAPEFDHVRDVDFCSGVFLMLPRALLETLGGLDADYAPAYYEEVDLCIRVWKHGLRVVYDPAIVIVHLEYGSSRNPDAPRALMRRNREVLLAKHRDWLAEKLIPDQRHILADRSTGRKRRVLFIEDTIPYRHIGSGFGRSGDVVASLVSLGFEVTVLPMNPVVNRPANPRCGFDDSVELLWDRDITHVPAFFAEREYFYDVVWVCRAHNLHRLAGVVGENWGPLARAQVVLDTEALVSNREAALAALEGRPFDLGRALQRELRQSFLLRDICVVNHAEREQLLAAGHKRVHVLSHPADPRPTPAKFARRHDILALGSLYGADTPNFDGLRWFLAHVWPLVSPRLANARLLIAGFVAEGVDAAGLLQGPNVTHLGFVDDPAKLYATARVFLAPTRFAAGIPVKVLEAAAHGVPVMTTDLICRQLDWISGRELRAASVDDPAAFADALVALYTQPAQWQDIRQASLKRLAVDYSGARFTDQVREILTPASSQARSDTQPERSHAVHAMTLAGGRLAQPPVL